MAFCNIVFSLFHFLTLALLLSPMEFTTGRASDASTIFLDHLRTTSQTNFCLQLLTNLRHSVMPVEYILTQMINKSSFVYCTTCLCDSILCESHHRHRQTCECSSASVKHYLKTLAMNLLTCECDLLVYIPESYLCLVPIPNPDSFFSKY